jgi:hypothetical protein
MIRNPVQVPTDDLWSIEPLALHDRQSAAIDRRAVFLQLRGVPRLATTEAADRIQAQAQHITVLRSSATRGQGTGGPKVLCQ